MLIEGKQYKIVRDICHHEENVGTIITIKKLDGYLYAQDNRYFYIGGKNGANNFYITEDDVEPVVTKEEFYKNLFKKR